LKDLEFDKIMDIYEQFSPKGKEVRVNTALKTLTPKTVAKRIKEAIKLSEELIWKKPYKS